jgi:serine/threonine protein kinase
VASANTVVPAEALEWPAPAPTEPDLPPELIGHPKFHVLRRLGQGGMGTVYLVEHRFMERPVALKVINRALLSDPMLLQRFFAEVKAASRLSHPNIVTAYDADRAGDLHFLVMEYVEGVNLADFLYEKGPLPVAAACDFVRQTALGLQHAHDREMVHRDIKPGNLIVLPDGQVKILDFGLARLTRGTMSGGALTQAGAFLGTPEYVAPEQAFDAGKADARSDIYSLGCTLYCLLTGGPPFRGLDAVLLRLQRDPEPMHRLCPGVPETLSVLVAKMLAREPDRRYQTAAAVATALAPFCAKGGELPESEPIPTALPVVKSWAKPVRSEPRSPSLHILDAEPVEEERRPISRPERPREEPQELRPTLRKWKLPRWLSAVLATLYLGATFVGWSILDASSAGREKDQWLGAVVASVMLGVPCGLVLRSFRAWGFVLATSLAFGGLFGLVAAAGGLHSNGRVDSIPTGLCLGLSFGTFVAFALGIPTKVVLAIVRWVQEKK